MLIIIEIASRDNRLILQKSDITLDKFRELANGNNEISRRSKFLRMRVYNIEIFIVKQIVASDSCA